MKNDYLAVDLGASSGRVIRGSVDENGLDLTEVHRFPTRVLRLPDGLHWDIGHLYTEILAGITRTVRDSGSPVSVAFDTWGVDYGLISEAGHLLGIPFSYRDERTRGRTEHLDHAFLFEQTGIQTQEINTLVQLLAEPRHEALEVAETLLFMPDLLAFLLTGVRATDRTIASTSQLLGLTGKPAPSVVERYGLPNLLPPVLPSGSRLGPFRAELAASTGFTGNVAIAAGHDTACAVAGIPAEDPNFAFISCGTWALVGFELSRPHVDAESRKAEFTNEHGADGTYRFLRNVTGMWLLNESMRNWQLTISIDELVSQAQSCERFASIIDPLDPVFIPPGDMPARIREYCGRTGQRVPTTPAETARCILDSLALSLTDTIDKGALITGVQPRVIHMVGGGSRIDDLCQTLANLAGIPVVAGPHEATARGNILLQARAHDDLSLEEMRRTPQPSMQMRRYEPGEMSDRDRARRTFRELTARGTHAS